MIVIDESFTKLEILCPSAILKKQIATWDVKLSNTEDNAGLKTLLKKDMSKKMTVYDSK